MQRFGPFVFEPDTRRLSRDGSDIHLTPKAFDLLALLIDAAPRVLAKAELHKRLWPTSYVSDATLVGLVKELRRALDDRDRAAPIIRTVLRVGYAFGRATTSRPAPADGVWSWMLVGGRRLPLREGENRIGRDPLSSVWIDVASISRYHARIVCNGMRAVIEDMGSKNGTTVGEEPVQAARELRDGDKISFGKVDAVFCASELGIPTVSEGEWSRPS